MTSSTTLFGLSGAHQHRTRIISCLLSIIAKGLALRMQTVRHLWRFSLATKRLSIPFCRHLVVIMQIGWTQNIFRRIVVVDIRIFRHLKSDKKGNKVLTRFGPDDCLPLYHLAHKYISCYHSLCPFGTTLFPPAISSSSHPVDGIVCGVFQYVAESCCV